MLFWHSQQQGKAGTSGAFEGNLPEHPISLAAGQTLTLTCNTTVAASETVLPISYPSLAGTGLAPGSQVFVGQYLFTGSETSSVYLTVQEVRGDEAVCTCNNTCVLEGLALTVHISHMRNEAPILAETDTAALRQWGAANRIDYVSVSFTRHAADIAVVRELLD
ncbi:Pyruvate kinase, cytosolic isozyme, partial [Tetrabaena socialis]